MKNLCKKNTKSGNQKTSMEERKTIQWPKKDEIQSTTQTTKD